MTQMRSGGKPRIGLQSASRIGPSVMRSREGWPAKTLSPAGHAVTLSLNDQLTEFGESPPQWPCPYAVGARIRVRASKNAVARQEVIERMANLGEAQREDH